MTTVAWHRRVAKRVDWETRRALLMLILVAVVFEAWNSAFFSVNDAYVVVLGLGSLGLASLAMGVTMLAGEFDLAIPSNAALAGIVAVDVSKDGLVVALLVVCAIGLVVGLVQGYLIWLLRINSLMLTIGSQIALLGLATLISHTQTVVASNIGLAVALQRRYFIFSPEALIAIAAFVLVGLMFSYTQLGREIRAAGGGRTEAIGSGVALWRPIVTVFVISGVLSGLLGGLSTLAVGSASATQFSTLLLNAVAGALIGGVSLRGGRGTVTGIILGVFVLGALSSGLTLVGAAYYVDEFAIGALLLFVIGSDIRRGRVGVAGVRARLAARARAARGPSTVRSERN
jgi:ribose transport system permease protein